MNMNRRHMDYALLLTTLVLIAIGVTMVYSSSAIFAREKFGDADYFLKRQLASVIIGFGALMIGKLMPLPLRQVHTYFILLFSLFLLALVHVPGVGITAGGAARWISIAGFSFQPSEFAKIALVFFMAYALDRKGPKLRQFGTGFLPPMLISLILIVFVLVGKDLGNAVLMGLTVLLMMYVAGARPAYLVAQIVLGLPAFYQLIASVDYRRRRIMAFLNPWEHRQDEGFQIIQSFVAFQAGGWLGAGLGEGRQKLFYLPEAHTDFIFSVVGEELGLLGVIFIMGLFAIWIWRALSIAWHAPSNYLQYLALGIGLTIGWLAILNMAVVMGLLPTKGVPLPFISYGGTSLVTNLFAVGVLLNISTRTSSEEGACT